MRSIVFCICLSAVLACRGQGSESGLGDTSVVLQLIASANILDFSNADSGLILSKRALAMARRLNYKLGESQALNECGESYHMLGDLPQSLKMQFEALALDREMNDFRSEAETLGYIGIVYIQLGEYREALQYLALAHASPRDIDIATNSSFILSNISEAYDHLKMPDSAMHYQLQAYQLYPLLTKRPHLRSFILRHMGAVYAESGKIDSALNFYWAAILNSRVPRDNINMSMAQRRVSELYSALHRDDSSLVYAREAFINARHASAKQPLLEASLLLASIYKKTNRPDSALFYADVATATKDSLYGPEKFRQLQLLMLQEQERQQTILQQQDELKNRIKYIALLSVLAVFLLLGFILLRNNRSKQIANNLLKEQKTRVEDTLSELRSTQTQLIQREKMASLGELTAAIAHEIQNPLNFVNNFSDVNTELIDELNLEAGKENMEQVKEISRNIKENEAKINHHGRRAEAIVKGMLQHSRSSTGKKESVDINALADEYLRLSYYGLRAKDKTFNAKLVTDLDEKAGRIEIIPQDISRVLLNLCNNAFYAVHEKKKESGEDYQPMVTLKTKKINNSIEILVADNGVGIPEAIFNKLFQPFFTTKPSGQGTGLGLSLSYDIVKAHGGEINFKSVVGEGTEFRVVLPIG